MKRALFLIVANIVFCFSLPAQDLTKGKIVDTKNHGIPYATVRILKNDSTFLLGTTTDSVGVYTFTAPPMDKYLLYVTSIGYESSCISLSSKQKNISPIILKENNVVLGEIEIKGQAFIRKNNHIQITPNSQQVKHAGTGYDLLYNLMIPNIDVEKKKGTVNTFGGSVSLYIDGQKAEYREIQNLRPKDIEKVEYYDVPSGKYASDIAAVNYITKQYQSGGYTALDARQYIGYLNGDYNVATKLTHGNTNYTLFAGYNIIEHDGSIKESTESFYFPDYQVDRVYTTLDGKSKNSQLYGQLNILNRNDKRTFSGKLTFIRKNAPDNFTSNLMDYTRHHEMNLISLNQTNQSGIMPTLELYGNFKLRNRQYIETTLRGSYSRNHYERNYQENEYTNYMDSREDFYEGMVGINYGLPLKHQNQLTFQLRSFYQNTATNYTGNNPLWQHLWNSTSLFYVEYTQNIGSKLNYQVMPGISAMYYRLHGNELVKQFSPRLQGRISYRLSKNQQLFATALLANSFPNINVLNNVDQVIDFMQIRRGNPNLENSMFYQTTLNYSLQLGKVNANLIGFYLYKQRPILSNYYIENDKLISSYEDNAHSNTANVVLSLSWKATPDLHFKVDGNYTHLSYGGTMQQAINDWKGSLQVNYYWKNFSLSAYGKTTSKVLGMDLGYSQQPGNYGFSGSWNYNNWRIEAGANSPFTKHVYFKYNLDTDVYNISQRYHGRIYQQNGYIKVAYTFDYGKKTSREWKNVNTNINSAILKAE